MSRRCGGVKRLLSERSGRTIGPRSLGLLSRFQSVEGRVEGLPKSLPGPRSVGRVMLPGERSLPPCELRISSERSRLASMRRMLSVFMDRPASRWRTWLDQEKSERR